MQELYDFFLLFLGFFKLPVAGWTFALFLLFLFFRQRLVQFFNNLLDLLGRTFASEIGSRRFEPGYKELIRPTHLYLKIVGIRTEEERRPGITEAYVPLKLLPKGESIEHAVSVEQMVQDGAYHLILGDPGAGKSTLLDYLTILYTQPQEKSKGRGKFLRVPSLSAKIHTPCPLYVSLRRCKGKNKALLADILDEGTEILPLPVRQRMPKRFIEHCVEHGRAILFLDGLDEVADESAYRSVVQKINEFVQLYPKNKLVVTCRKAGWRGDLSPNFQISMVLPLDSQQQRHFVRKWYAAVLQYLSRVAGAEVDLQRRAEREANHLLSLLQTKERLSELASNPLMLSLICLVHKQRKDLPRGRAALYRDCLDILLDLWDRIDKEFDQQFPTIEQKKHLLRHIAYRMHSRGLREVDRRTLEDWTSELLPQLKEGMTPADIVHQIEVRCGVIAERSIDKLAFSHLTLQEYLVVEYFLYEQNGNFPLSTITDWGKWREPVLLMCGMANDPLPFLRELFFLQPLLGLAGVAEANPAQFDTQATQRLVDEVIARINQQTIEINEAIPALIGLLSMEGNPFGESVLRVVYSRIHACSIVQASAIIEALSKSPTRDAANILLSLLSQPGLERLQSVLIDGLARIGDNSLYEAQEWREACKLSEEQFFQILANCFTLFASKTLWERYQLEPPPGQELAWAQSWALRLAEQETDDLLRPLTTPAPGITDPKAWPYRQNDRCVIAALVSRTFAILQKTYGSYSLICKDSDLFTRFSLRLQVPLLIYCKKDTAPVQATIFTHPSAIENFPANALTDWSMLDHEVRSSQKASLGEGLFFFTNVAILLVIAFFTSAGLTTLLPPDGHIVDFWLRLPLWAKIALFPGLFLLNYALVSGLSLLSGDNLRESILPSKRSDLTIFFVVLLFFTLAPATWLYIAPISLKSTKSIRWAIDLIKLKKIPWFTTLFLFLGICAITFLGFLALRLWLTGLFLLLCTLLFTAATIENFFFFIWMLLPNKSEVAIWLQGHPRATEVLNEFI